MQQQQVRASETQGTETQGSETRRRRQTRRTRREPLILDESRTSQDHLNAITIYALFPEYRLSRRSHRGRKAHWWVVEIRADAGTGTDAGGWKSIGEGSTAATALRQAVHRVEVFGAERLRKEW